MGEYRDQGGVGRSKANKNILQTYTYKIFKNCKRNYWEKERKSVKLKKAKGSLKDKR